MSRFVPERAIHTVEQEYFFPYECSRVFAEFLKNFTSLLPEKLQTTIKLDSGALRVGSRLIATPMYLTRPLVAVEIVSLTDCELGYAYLQGGPLLGSNTLRFVSSAGGTSAVVTLRYQLNGLLTPIGWYLLGGRRFHRKLIAVGFRTLEGLLGGKQ